MFETRINMLIFVSRWIDQIYVILRRSGAASVEGRIRRARGILRHKRGAAHRRYGSAGQDVLMGREAGALVGLKHAIGESEAFGELKIRSHETGIDILELRICAGGRAVWLAKKQFDLVGAVHLSVVIHLRKRYMRVVEVIAGIGFGVVVQIGRRQLDHLSVRVDASVLNVRTRCNQRGVLKQIIRRSIFLVDHDDVLDLDRKSVV